MFNTSFIQIVVCILLIFLLFGDLKKFKNNTLFIKEFFKKYLKKKQEE